MAINFDIEALREDDDQEWLKMMRYVYNCCRLCYWIYYISEPQIIKDMSQKKMLRFHEGRAVHRVSSGWHLINFIRKSVYNNVTSEMKRYQKYKSEDIDNVDYLEASQGDPADVDSEIQRKHFVQKLYRRLTKKERPVLSIIEKCGEVDYDRICRELSISRDYAYVLVSRIAKKAGKIKDE